uniref:Uncharacterized protein n=1 Tax=Plectus sambesii TaxID=2011161 RepID=A0A914XHF9_9BILA
MPRPDEGLDASLMPDIPTTPPTGELSASESDSPHTPRRSHLAYRDRSSSPGPSRERSAADASSGGRAPSRGSRRASPLSSRKHRPVKERLAKRPRHSDERSSPPSRSTSQRCRSPRSSKQRRHAQPCRPRDAGNDPSHLPIASTPCARSNVKLRSVVPRVTASPRRSPPTSQVWTTSPTLLQARAATVDVRQAASESFIPALDVGPLKFLRELHWSGPPLLFPFDATCVIVGRNPSPFDLHSQCFGRGHESCNAVLLCALKQDSPEDVRRLPFRSLEAARHALALLRRNRSDLVRPVLQCDPSVIPQVLAELSPPLAAEELSDIAYAATLLYRNCLVLRAALLSTGLSPIVCVLPHVGIGIPPPQLLGRGLVTQPNLLGKGLETIRATLFYPQRPQLQCAPLIFVGDEQAGLLDCHGPPCADCAVRCFPGIAADAFASLFAQQYFVSSVAVVVISVGLAELAQRSQELVGRYQEVLAQCSPWPHIRFVVVPPLSNHVAYETHVELSRVLHTLCRQHKVTFADVLPSFQRGSSFQPLYFSDGRLNVLGVDLVLAYLRERRLLPIPSMDGRRDEQRFSAFFAASSSF